MAVLSQPPPCDHSGFWTCESRLDREARKVLFRMVCDECHEQMKDLCEDVLSPPPVAAQR